MQTYAQRQQSLQLSSWADKILNAGNRPPKPKNTKSFGSTGTFAPSCNCDVLPWDDCIHTSDESAELALIRSHC